MRRTGDESIHEAGRSLGVSLLSFWQWSSSDLVSNATRGVLAEYLVATALEVPPPGVRREWDEGRSEVGRIRSGMETRTTVNDCLPSWKAPGLGCRDSDHGR